MGKTYGGRPVLVKSKTKCGAHVKWVADPGGVVAVLVGRSGRSLNLIRGYGSLPKATVRHKAERRLLSDHCKSRRRHR